MGVNPVAVRWVALFAGPFLFLLNVQVAYLLAPWSCGEGSELVLHLAHAGILLLGLAVMAAAWWGWREAGRKLPGEGSGAVEQHRFVGLLALISAATFALLLVALWLPSFALDPCAWT